MLVLDFISLVNEPEVAKTHLYMEQLKKMEQFKNTPVKKNRAI